MQQRRVSDNPCRRAQIRRLPGVRLLNAGHGVGPGQRTSTAYSASSVRLSTNHARPISPVARCALGRRWRLGSREGGHALRARSGIGLCVVRARVSRHCGSGVIQLAFFLEMGRKRRGVCRGMAGGEHTYRPHQLRRKIEQRHTRVRRYFVFFHVMGDQPPAHGSLSAFIGGVMEEAGRFDLSYLAARREK
jgi:hypothetical protein